jgi:hypothetical protein
MLPGNILQRPVLLSWKVPIPNELHDSGSCFFRDRLCAIGARGINHYDLLGEGNAGNAVAQVRRFILDWDKH